MAEEAKKETKKPQEKKAPEADGSKKIAIVRIRGLVNVRHDVKKTLTEMKLYRKNYCVVLPNTKENMGRIMKVKDHVTWGDIDDSLYSTLIEKRGEEYKGRTEDSKGKIKYDSKYVEVTGKKYKKFFRLNSPKKGFGRKGIKTPFNLGGGLGNRGDKMKDLITNMLQ